MSTQPVVHQIRGRLQRACLPFPYPQGEIAFDGAVTGNRHEWSNVDAEVEGVREAQILREMQFRWSNLAGRDSASRWRASCLAGWRTLNAL